MQRSLPRSREKQKINEEKDDSILLSNGNSFSRNACPSSRF
jgi:hypothetical protein